MISKVLAGLKAFKESFLSSTPEKEEDFSDFDARKLRYSILWSMYEGTAYREIHTWARSYKREYALYKWLRSIRNPAHLIAEFQVSHIFGGLLDDNAGPTGAIPIITDNDALREAIADIWKWSQWGRNKDILALQGAVFGDIFIRVVDDRKKERIYLEVVHPGVVKDVTIDSYGNVKGYVIEETREHPESGIGCTYTEVVSRSGQDVVYKTYLNNSPYAWPEMDVATWSNAYGFVPFVQIKHVDVGLPFGWSELHPGAGRMREIDEMTSMLSDHLRKVIDPLWLMKGIDRPKQDLSSTLPTRTTPEPDREEVRALWDIKIDASAEALTTTLDITAVIEHIDKMMGSLEADYPEIRPDLVTPGSTISGRALRIARQPMERRILQRRANYDAAVVTAQEMAISVGGYRNYYPFNLDSYEKGDLQHHVADRPVFMEDPEDKASASKGFWEAAKLAVETGISLEYYLETQGWSEEEIENAIRERTQLQAEGPKPIQEG